MHVSAIPQISLFLIKIVVVFIVSKLMLQTEHTYKLLQRCKTMLKDTF